MILEIVNCNDQSLIGILSIIKNLITLMQIIIPIVLIISVIISLLKLIKNLEEKNSTKRITNKFIAAIIIFFIPILLDAAMSLVGSNTKLSSCWNSANNTITQSNKYIEEKTNKKNILEDSSKYDNGKKNNRDNSSNKTTSGKAISLEASTLGEKMARLAVRVSPNADPDQRILCHPWLHWGVDRATIGTKMSDYVKIMDATTTKYLGDTKNPNHTITKGNYNNPAYCSCTQGSGAIVRAIADPDLDMSGDISVYLRAHPEKWQAVGVVKVGERFDDKCMPGDLLVHRLPANLNVQGISTHTMMYVGHEIAKEKFPNTNGNIFQTGYNSRDVEHSWGPQINYMATDGREFTIWRPTGKGTFYYPFIDVEKVLSGTMTTGKFW